MRLKTKDSDQESVFIEASRLFIVLMEQGAYMQYFSTQTVFTRKEYTESYSPTIYVKLHCNRMYKSNLSFYIYLYRDIWWLRPGCTWFFSPLAQGECRGCFCAACHVDRPLTYQALEIPFCSLSLYSFQQFLSSESGVTPEHCQMWPKIQSINS